MNLDVPAERQMKPQHKRKKVFVAYSARDRKLANKLVDLLRDNGFYSFDWFDLTKQPPGADMGRTLRDAIEETEILLFIVSPASLASHWCMWEVRAALEMNKRVIPIVGRRVDDEHLPSYLSQYNLLYFTDDGDKDANDALVNSLVAASTAPAEKRGNKVFISYRRTDTEHVSGRIFDWLEREVGADQVFFDVETIPVGVDFTEIVRKSIWESAVVIAIIGRNWLRKPNIVSRWLGHSGDEDYVRIELETAIQYSVRVLPVTTDGAIMPRRTQLPPTISQLSYINAAPVRSGADFRLDVKRVIKFVHDMREFVASASSVKA